MNCTCSTPITGNSNHLCPACKATEQAVIDRRIYLDIRGYESGRMIKGEMAPTTRRHKIACGMHLQ